MPRRVKTTSAKIGNTAAKRRVLSDVSTITAEPTKSGDGYIIEQNELAHLMFDVSGTNPVFRVRYWLYSLISGKWHKGRQVVVQTSDLVTIEMQGMDRIYLQVELTPAGTNPKLDAWIALVRPV